MTPTIAPGADAHALAQLQSACGCSEQEAQRALSAASGDLTRAKELAAHLVHRYLLVGVTIEERGKSAATEGAILALWERGHPKPRWTGALLTTTAHGAITGWHPTSPHDWGLLLRDRGEKLTAYDRKASQHLADYIQIQTFPIPMDHCFAAPETLPPLVRPGADGEPERCTRDQLLAHSFELMLRGALSFPFNCRLAWFPLTPVDHADLAPAMGWEIPQEGEPEPTPVPAAATDTGNPFSSIPVCLRGSLIIDPQHGVLVDDLRPGDRVALQILDRSPLAMRVGQLLGIRDGANWSPTWGVVQATERLDSGSRRVLTLIAEKVECETVALGSLRVKQHLPPGTETPWAPGAAAKGVPAGSFLVGVVIFLGLVLAILLGGNGF